MHNNRCGDIDPYIIFYLVESCGMTLEEVKQMLRRGADFTGCPAERAAICATCRRQPRPEKRTGVGHPRILLFDPKIHRRIRRSHGRAGRDRLRRRHRLEQPARAGAESDFWVSGSTASKTVWRLPEWISPWRTPRPRLHRPYRREIIVARKGGGTVGY